MKSLESIPNIRQVKLLSEMAIALAKEQDKYKAITNATDTCFFLPREIEQVSIDGPESEIADERYRFIGRLGKVGRTGWSMRLIEDQLLGGVRNSAKSRSVYSFEWGATKVTRSEVVERFTITPTENLLTAYGATGYPSVLHETPKEEHWVIAAQDTIMEDVTIEREAIVRQGEYKALLDRMGAYCHTSRLLHQANQL
jgi:hypothetical protein